MMGHHLSPNIQDIVIPRVKGTLFMQKSKPEYIKAKRTGLGVRSLESGRLVQNTINQHLKRTVLGDVRFELGRTHQNFIEKCCGRTGLGFIKKFGRLGLSNTKYLGRTTPGNLTIKCGRSVAGYRKVEFSRTAMGDLAYKTDRVVGGFHKINLSRQVSENANYDMARTQYGNDRQFGRVVPAFGRKFGRVSPNTIQCGRVVGGIIQPGHTTPAY
jgi:hypothetical protein